MHIRFGNLESTDKLVETDLVERSEEEAKLQWTGLPGRWGNGDSDKDFQETQNDKRKS